ncbi:hypothetical protein BDY19DRAFT_886993 [Irpex rosettiformis]|uniref:Uncharacterized protein n=1 Tax=Irpex rosettiformis TaxID=378272 RepID=A0ACB8U8N1_9APHY|nr:hypothetical protein BDY19DRAFT_886993 [Irpex rosettiformis]
MPALRNSLDIRLTESVVFLRTGDGTGRARHGSQPAAPPAMVRGLLTMNIVKPTKISSIEIELLGKTSTAWPEGMGSRRVEVNEEHKIHSQTYVLFKAGSSAHPITHKRTMSVGPGLHLDYDDHDDHSSESSENDPRLLEDERRGREPTRGRQRERPVLPRQLSADQTIFQSGFVSQRNEQLPTPPYSPPYSRSATPMTRSPAPSVTSPISMDEASHYSLDDIRRMTSEHNSTGDSGAFDHARSPSTSYHDLHSPSLSRRVSLEEPRPPEFVVGSSTGPVQPPPPAFVPGPSRSAIGRGAASVSPISTDDRGRRGRMSIGLFLDAVKEKVRSVSRATAERDTPPHSLTRDGSGDNFERRDSSNQGRVKDRRDVHPALERVTEVSGMEAEEEDDGEIGWKEFRKGVYTYPVSFAIPSGSPPTMACEFGMVTWRLKAYAHRPGTFTTKLSAGREVVVVASPSEDDTEDSESIIVERQWDTQMQYLITISGRSFPVGGVIPFSITFAPWTKMKVFRLHVVIEERVDYFSDFKKLVRTDPLNRVVLLALKDQHKDHPILPLDSNDIEAFKGSPLYSDAESDEEVSETIANLMGPGPWAITRNIPLPKTCNELHFTNKNKKSNITVSHTLKIIFRVQRGDDQEVDKQTGKRKMFDIVVQTPIHILSCLCGPDFTALPPYSEHPFASDLALPSVMCNCRQHLSDGCTGNVTPVEMSPALFPGGITGRSHSSARVGHPMPSPESRQVQTLPRANGGNRLPLSRGDSMQERSTQFERLIAGHESEIGEAPPAYEQVAAA